MYWLYISRRNLGCGLGRVLKYAHLHSTLETGLTEKL